MNKRQIDDILALAGRQHSIFSLGQAGSLGVTPPELQAAVERGVAVPPPARGIRGRRRVRLGPPAVDGGTAGGGATFGCLTRFSGGGPRVRGNPRPDHRTDDSCAPAPPAERGDDPSVDHTQALRCPGTRWTAGHVADPDAARLGTRLGAHILGEVLDEGSIARLWTPGQVAARYGQLTTGSLPSALPNLLELRLDDGTLRSRLEQRVCRVLRPVVEPFEVNHVEVLDGVVIEMDLAWCADKIDGEVDGLRERTASRTKFLRQCRRENILAAHGWRIVHFTHEMDDETIISQVAPLLGRKSVNS